MAYGALAVPVEISISNAVIAVAQVFKILEDEDLRTNCNLQLFIKKPQALVFAVMSGPIYEEVFFRGLVQGVILDAIPKAICKTIVPRHVGALDSTAAKVVRITTTAAVFAAAHVVNLDIYSFTAQATLVSTFVGGIAYGALKEMSPGILGSVGAHIAHNTFTMAHAFYTCSS